MIIRPSEGVKVAPPRYTLELLSRSMLIVPPAVGFAQTIELPVWSSFRAKFTW